VIWKSLYAGLLLAGVIVSVVVGIWVHRKRDADNRRLFVLYMAANAVWALSVLPLVLVDSAWVQYVSIHLDRFFGAVTVFLFTHFAFRYTSHDTSLDNPIYAGVVAGLVLSVLFVLGSPVHGLLLADVSTRAEPFWHLAVTEGPGGQFTAIWSFVVIGLSVYYFIELFVRSRHRSSLSVLLIILASAGSSTPSILSEFGYLPVPGFNETALGIVLFVVPASYAIFELGMLDIPPVARDKLMDQLVDPVLVTDGEHTIVDYTEACAALDSAFDQRDPVGESMDEVVPSFFDIITFPEEPETTRREQLSIQDGPEKIHYSVLVSPILEQGDIVGYAILFQDVTELEAYKRELEHRNEQLDQFANAVSHDLRNPLNVAKGYTEVLETALSRLKTDEKPDPEQLQSQLSQIEHSHRRMSAIIDDLRTMAKQGDAVEDTEPMDLAAAVNSAWSNVALPEASIEVSSTGTIHVDRSRLLSILENLFRNAADHGPEDVTLEVGFTDDGFYVADDGPGIPDDEVDEIFEYGYTTHDEGTGFGLSIVKMMTDSHGWSVTVDTGYDEGARFVFSDVAVGQKSEQATKGGTVSVE